MLRQWCISSPRYWRSHENQALLPVNGSLLPLQRTAPLHPPCNISSSAGACPLAGNLARLPPSTDGEFVRWAAAHKNSSSCIRDQKDQEISQQVRIQKNRERTGKDISEHHYHEPKLEDCPVCQPFW